MSTMSTTNNTADNKLQCDYLVIGAGTTGMSFVDTILTENPNATIIIVDRNAKAGGHWTKAYPFVRLHQSSSYYGVNSHRLGKLSDSKGREAHEMNVDFFNDANTRATGAEIIQYYEKVTKYFNETGRVRFLFNSEYKESKDDGSHCIITTVGDNGSNNSGVREIMHSVQCRKLVTVLSNVVVPSMRKAPFRVHPSVSFIPVNDIPNEIKSGGTGSKYQNFFVLGAGKTAADAIIHLLTNGIDQSKITWIISRDVWFLLRDNVFKGDFFKAAVNFIKPLSEANSIKNVFLTYEEKGIIGRLQPKCPSLPEVFKGATIYTESLRLLRSVANTVRLGRVTCVNDGEIILQRGKLNFSTKDTLFIDCMADNFYGYASFDKDLTIFESNRINLGPIFSTFNISFSAAMMAHIESSFETNETKNGFCYFLRGKYLDDSPKSFVGMVYAQYKTFGALRRHKPSVKFLLKSRLNQMAPMHHGGILKFLWAVYGPLQIPKVRDQLVNMIERKGFNDLDHCFGVESLPVKEYKPNLQQQRKSSSFTVIFLGPVILFIFWFYCLKAHVNELNMK